MSKGDLLFPQYHSAPEVPVCKMPRLLRHSHQISRDSAQLHSLSLATKLSPTDKPTLPQTLHNGFSSLHPLLLWSSPLFSSFSHSCLCPPLAPLAPLTTPQSILPQKPNLIISLYLFNLPDDVPRTLNVSSMCKFTPNLKALMTGH